MSEVTSIGEPSHARTLGWRAERRPAPGFAHVLGAVAGAFAVIAMVAFVVAGTGDSGIFSGSVTQSCAMSVGCSDTTQSASVVNNTSDAAAGAVMMLGIAYLVAGGVLDRRRLAGAATPFLAVGAVAAIIGGVTLGATESALLAGVVAVLIGAAVGVIGAAGHVRRGTTWFGVLVVFAGLVAVLADVAPDEEAGIGAIALLIAVVCGALAWWLAGVLGEPDDGDDRPAPPDSPDTHELRSAA